ncbi:MAG: FAD-binding and (Fe-S)-binding domain-containing protein [Thermoguttaceae bacterium]
MSSLSPQQSRLRDDIRGLIKGEICCEAITTQLYSTDGGLLQVRPQGVVMPRDVDDVIALVKYAAERGISIHSRGAGTGTSGESLGSGLVIDWTRFMRRILDRKSDSVVIQPGLFVHRLNSILNETQKRIFGPVCGLWQTTTFGSVLARNGAGRNWLRYRFPSDHLSRLKVVLADGEVLTLDRSQLPQAIPIPMESRQRHNSSGFSKSFDSVARGLALARGIVMGREHTFADEVYRILNNEMPLVLSLAKSPPINRAGYACHDVLRGLEGNEIDLARLFCGSEGSLGLIVEAEVKTVSPPIRGAGAVLFFDGIEKAIQAVESILRFRPVLCELADRRRLRMVQERDGNFHSLIPYEAEAVIFVEIDAGTHDSMRGFHEVRLELDELIDTVWHKKNLTTHVERIDSTEVFAVLDLLLHQLDMTLFGMQRSLQPLSLFDDFGIPVAGLWAFISELLDVLRNNGVTASISGHVGQGHLRIQPILDVRHPDLEVILDRLMQDVSALVFRHKGTINTETGTGLLKSWLLPQQFPKQFHIFRNIKEIFDPNDLFQPGKVIPNQTQWTHWLRHDLPLRGNETLPESHPLTNNSNDSTSSVFSNTFADTFSSTSNLLPSNAAFKNETEIDASIERKEKSTQKVSKYHGTWSAQLEHQLKWDPLSIVDAAHICNGCGDCRRSDNQSRACPVFRVSTDESISPRAKVNLMRGVLSGNIDLESLTLDAAKHISEACLQCKMCEIECAANVEITKLAFHGKSAYIAAHGLSPNDFFFSRLDTILNVVHSLHLPLNKLLKYPFIRWILEKAFQIPQGRRLPSLASVPFLKRKHLVSNRSNVADRNVKRRLESSDFIKLPAKKVALFIDTFANHFETQIAEWAIRILEHNNIEVFVPLQQRASGILSFATGHRDRAEQLTRHNALLLADLIRQGFQVITLESSSASCLSKNYRFLSEDIDVDVLSSHVLDFHQFLWKLHDEKNLRTDLLPIKKQVAYHAPCHSLVRTAHFVTESTPAQKLLELIPQLHVHRIECGCCGLGGIYGLKTTNHNRSIRMGVALFGALRQSSIDFGTSDCSSCLMQMRHGVAEKNSLHTIQMIACAFGLCDINE